MIDWRTLRAVFFDAVGTLIHPEPSVGVVYSEAARRFGSRVSAEELPSRFRKAFQRQEQLDQAAGLRTGEERERQRWQEIVAEVIDDGNDREGCFAVLYEHFARPESWRVAEGAGEVLRELTDRGLQLGLASNFDERLAGLVQALPELARLQHVVISSQVGWKKPAGPFFQQLSKQTGHPPGMILMIGDDLMNDYEGAQAAGLQAVLFDPLSRESSGDIRRISRLADLLPLR